MRVQGLHLYMCLTYAAHILHVSLSMRPIQYVWLSSLALIIQKTRQVRYVTYASSHRYVSDVCV
jgi:hypothetical protein